MSFFDSAVAHNLALWNQSQDAIRVYIKSDTADSSIHPIEEADEVVEVKTVRLDHVLPRRSYKLLKPEAEGAEPGLLEGASGILGCFDHVTVDVGFDRGLKQESTLPEVTNIRLRSGFSFQRLGRGRDVIPYVNDRLA